MIRQREFAPPKAQRGIRGGLLAAVACMSMVFSGSLSSAPMQERQGSSPTRGTASWYGEEFAGRTTANGEVFEPLLLTGAHRTYPFGTVVDVRNTKSGRTTRIRINDRGPYIADRLIDLSYAAAKEIDLIETGSGEVDLTVVSVGRGENEPPAPYTVTLAQTRSNQTRQEPAPTMAETVVTTSVTTTTTTATVPAVETRPSPAPQAVASADPPVVAFPLPTEVASTPSRPAGATAEAVVSNVQVVEERQGVETRRQVANDGRTVEHVASETGEPVSSPAPTLTAESLDRAAMQANAQTNAQAAADSQGRRFIVQIGAFSKEANAAALQELLAGFSMRSHIVKDRLYRVRMGPFDTREQAIRTRNDLEAKGVSAIVVPE